MYFPGLTSPSPAPSRGQIRRNAVIFATGSLRTHFAPSGYRSNSFQPTFRYRGALPTESACGRDPCRRAAPCVQLAASL
ncbi:ribosomal large subunit pseudouridine synthase C [Burkholderia ambifaria AMMD]|uniref:Ribosomal large subunit pseudouridine synthase C n=1 Tax=Burkholderia ambifaria (strain ATCC BAA-244 / DSM 16087 / CCUG 44356 / LMG 19182 / AMMD) TaxID=339670 RepID=Q0BH27_BURCM|nr:ribosomal large subunit pseudouridine synthase C [Burkholderia ambifaria AMMD]